MRNFTFKYCFLSTIMLFISFFAIGQNFEGVIEFKKVTTTDTTNYIYYVKNNTIRIDEMGSKSNKVEGSFLVDLDAKTMRFLNHDRKLYGYQNTPSAPIIKGNCVVKKGSNVKNLQGYKCSEYIVTNTDENTEIIYYIADGKFSFFEKLLRYMNRKEKSSIYYLQIPNIKNSFPMLSIQSDLNKKEQLRLEVTRITKKNIDFSIFEIPKGYNKFEK